MSIPWFGVSITISRDYFHASQRRYNSCLSIEIQNELNRQSKKSIDLINELLDVAGRFEQICRRDTVDGIRLRELLEECKGDAS